MQYKNSQLLPREDMLYGNLLFKLYAIQIRRKPQRIMTLEKLQVCFVEIQQETTRADRITNHIYTYSNNLNYN